MKKEKKIYKSLVEKSGGICELLYNKDENKTYFACYLDEKFEKLDTIKLNEDLIYPMSADSQIIKQQVVLLPSDIGDFSSEEELISDIRNFIHKYLEISPFFEKIAPFYVLFTWIYDKFKELPYLRAIADYGQGKSRFLKTVGSICYKPMFTVGATTTAPIFRLISQFKGTLILDEADYKFSDTNVEIIKILNNGFQAGMSILRCADGKDNYDLQAFDVFCPKIVATRNRFQDKALESRFLVEYMDGKLNRTDIPMNLDDNFDKEALEIRNKCLVWRLKNYNLIDVNNLEYDKSIEPRLNQIIAPLCSIIKDEEVKNDLKKFIKEYNKELTTDRGLSFEAPILEIVINLMKVNNSEVTMKDISDVYNVGIGKSDRELSPRKMGNIVRDILRLKTIKKNVGYTIDKQHFQENKERLCGKYGIESEQVNVVNVVQGCDDEFVREVKDLGFKDLPSF